MYTTELRLDLKTKEAIAQTECLFQASTPDHIMIFSERKRIVRPVIEAASISDDGQLTYSTFNIKKLRMGLDIYKIDYELNERPLNNRANKVYDYAMRRALETSSLTTVVLISLPPISKEWDFDGFAKAMLEIINSERIYKGSSSVRLCR